MGGPDVVEFLSDDGPAFATDDEVVEIGTRRVSRPVLVLAGLAVSAVAVAALVAGRAHSSATHSASSPSGSSTVPSVPLPVVPAQSPAVGPPVAVPFLPRSGSDPVLPGSGPIEAAVASGNRLYILQPGQLSLILPHGSLVISFDGPDQAGSGDTVQMIADGARLWVVTTNSATAQLIEYDANTLAELRRVAWPHPIATAAALHGHLYFSTTAGVAELAPSAARAALVPALRGYTDSMAADPRRSRLLLLDSSARAHVRAYLPGTGLLPVSGDVPFGKGQLAVTADGAIWAAGFGDQAAGAIGAGGFGVQGDGAVLVPLDPRTLAPQHASPVSRQLGPGAILAAAGTADILVRSGAGGDALWCIDGDSGQQLQYWPYAAGSVTAVHGAAYVVSTEGARPLNLDTCAG